MRRHGCRHCRCVFVQFVRKEKLMQFAVGVFSHTWNGTVQALVMCYVPHISTHLITDVDNNVTHSNTYRHTYVKYFIFKKINNISSNDSQTDGGQHPEMSHRKRHRMTQGRADGARFLHIADGVVCEWYEYKFMRGQGKDISLHRLQVTLLIGILGSCLQSSGARRVSTDVYPTRVYPKRRVNLTSGWHCTGSRILLIQLSMCFLWDYKIYFLI